MCVHVCVINERKKDRPNSFFSIAVITAHVLSPGLCVLGSLHLLFVIFFNKNLRIFQNIWKSNTGVRPSSTLCIPVWFKILINNY